MINIDIKTKIEIIIEEMTRVYKNDARPWVIGYSGGKDSTTVVQLTFIENYILKYSKFMFNCYPCCTRMLGEI